MRLTGGGDTNLQTTRVCACIISSYDRECERNRRKEQPQLAVLLLYIVVVAVQGGVPSPMNHTILGLTRENQTK